MKSLILLYILPKNKCKNITYPESVNFIYFSMYGESVKRDVRKWQQSKVKHLQSTRSRSQTQVSPMLNHAELDSWSILCQDIDRCKSLISESPQEKIQEQLRPWTITTEIHSPHNSKVFTAHIKVLCCCSSATVDWVRAYL